LIASAEASDPRFKVVPAVRIVADPLKDARPLADSVLKEPAAGIPEPIAGGAANAEPSFSGVTIRASSVYATVSAVVASSAIPARVSLARGAPAIAIRPTVCGVIARVVDVPVIASASVAISILPFTVVDASGNRSSTALARVAGLIISFSETPDAASESFAKRA
jgi:hypothetical protein